MLHFRSFYVLFFFMSSAVCAFAQFRGGVEGTVTDPSGGVVPSAKISLLNNETQRKLETTSTGDGFYRFTGLAPGSYSLSAEVQGFKQADTKFNLSAESTQSVNLTLETGKVSETVTVTSDSSPAVETTNGNVTRAITAAEIQKLPQVGRNPYELVRLTPGIFGDGARGNGGGAVNLPNTTGPGGSNSSIFQTENQIPVSANGQRVSNNNIQIDGVSVNSLSYGGAAVITPNQESVKEMRVNANSYTPDLGRNSGAQIQIISQNGTNQFHGSAAFKYQNPNFNAFQKFGGVNSPPARVNTAFRNYATSFGGPIVKNNLFAFFSYEGVTNNSVGVSNQWIETDAYRQSLLSLRPNSIAAQILNQPGSSPRVISLLPNTACPSNVTCRNVNGGADLGSNGGVPGRYFGPQNSTASLTGAGLDGIPDMVYAQLQLPTRLRGNQYNGRMDYTRGSNAIAGSVYLTTLDRTDADGPGGSRPNQDQSFKPVNTLVTLIYNRTLTPTTVNEARANFTRYAFNQLTANSLVNFGIPRIELQGLQVDRIRFGPNRDETYPAIFAQNTYEFRDTLSKVIANHALKFGFELRREQDNNSLVGGARPLYVFDGMFNFPNDAPINEAINANPQTGQPANAQRYFRTNTWAGFIGDDWKVTPKLTLNLGIRWEFFTPLREKRDQLSNFFFSSPGTLVGGRVLPVDRLTDPNTNNFAPRIGFAWNPSEHIVLRGGYGIFYNRVPNVLWSNTRGNPPNFSRFNVCCGDSATPFADNRILYSLGQGSSIYGYPFNPALATGIDPRSNTPNGSSVEVWGAPTRFPTPYSHTYSLEANFTFAKDNVATLGFQGSTGHHLIRLLDQRFVNQYSDVDYPALGNLGARPVDQTLSAVYFATPDVNSNYNALLATLSRRLSSGFQFQANYRFAKSIDTNSYEGPGAVTNQTYPQDQRQERGPSDFDTKHTLTVSSLYEVPFFRDQKTILGKILGGFQINGVFTFHTGFPWTPVSGQSLQTPGGPTLAPTRPYAYLGGALTNQDNDAFINGTNFPGGPNQYFLYVPNVGQTALPPGIGRNVFRGPWFKSVDVSVAKAVKFPNKVLGEAAQIDLRLNLFNAFNQLNLAPFQFDSDSTHVDRPQFFGRPTSSLAGRVVELQARFSF